MKFDPIGMGGTTGQIGVVCACIYNGPGCGPVTRTNPCVCRIGGLGPGWIEP